MAPQGSSVGALDAFSNFLHPALRSRSDLLTAKLLARWAVDGWARARQLLRMIKYLAGLAILLSPLPACARDWPSAGGWDVAEVDGNACAMAMEYDGEGSTALGVILDTKANVLLVATNDNWSASKGQAYELVYFLNGLAYSGGKSVGTESGFKKGFVTSFDPAFLGDFAKASAIIIKSKDGVMIDDLSLAGSAAGLSVLRRCVAHVKSVADAEARERARFAHIPKDPFATVAGEPIPGTEPAAGRVESARAKGDLASLISPADYPASAVRGGEEGTTAFRLDIGANGRVTGCTITSSSGSSALDSATCRLMKSRARFTPAIDSSGNPTTDTISSRYTWRATE
jgi:periplasmic protein TonB